MRPYIRSRSVTCSPFRNPATEAFSRNSGSVIAVVISKVSSRFSACSAATIRVIIFVIEAGYIFSSPFFDARTVLFSRSMRIA